jgi:hypothetical protein
MDFIVPFSEIRLWEIEIAISWSETFDTVLNESGTRAPCFAPPRCRELPGCWRHQVFLSGSKQYVTALFSDGAYAGPEGLIAGANFRRAVPGDRLLLYGIGFGATTPAVGAGSIAPPLAALPNAQVRVGGVAALLEYAGLTGGLVGLYQFNLVVPAGVTGDVPLTLTLTVDGIAGAQDPPDHFRARVDPTTWPSQEVSRPDSLVEPPVL